jgi:hypothetical protein
MILLFLIDLGITVVLISLLFSRRVSLQIKGVGNSFYCAQLVTIPYCYGIHLHNRILIFQNA